MPFSQHRMVERCLVLREDPDLLEYVPAAQRARATEQCIAPAVMLDTGQLTEEELPPIGYGGVGLLILGGLVVHRVEATGRSGAELLGPGDLLRPRHGAGPSEPLPYTVHWRVLKRLRVAVLDVHAAARFAAYPALLGAITARALDRARTLALMMAIVHQPRIEARLHMLLWHLADRWGRVRGDGVVLPLRLSHSLLSDLVCARRPSVTVALQRLSERGLVERLPDGWLLHGDPTSVVAGPASGPPGPARSVETDGCAERDG